MTAKHDDTFKVKTRASSTAGDHVAQNNHYKTYRLPVVDAAVPAGSTAAYMHVTDGAEQSFKDCDATGELFLRLLATKPGPA